MTIHRLILTEDQSRFLVERGQHFVVVTPGSYPDAMKRHVLFVVECDATAATQACEVALGRARVTMRRGSKIGRQEPPDPLET